MNKKLLIASLLASIVMTGCTVTVETKTEPTATEPAKEDNVVSEENTPEDNNADNNDTPSLDADGAEVLTYDEFLGVINRCDSALGDAVSVSSVDKVTGVYSGDGEPVDYTNDATTLFEVDGKYFHNKIDVKSSVNPIKQETYYDITTDTGYVIINEDLYSANPMSNPNSIGRLSDLFTSFINYVEDKDSVSVTINSEAGNSIMTLTVPEYELTYTITYNDRFNYISTKYESTGVCMHTNVFQDVDSRLVGQIHSVGEITYNYDVSIVPDATIMEQVSGGSNNSDFSVDTGDDIEIDFGNYDFSFMDKAKEDAASIQEQVDNIRNN